MPRFDLFRLARPEGRVRYVVDVQSDLLRHLKTRVVVPLVPAGTVQIGPAIPDRAAVIASAAKQSRGQGAMALDCFAALAMTGQPSEGSDEAQLIPGRALRTRQIAPGQ